MAKTSLSRNTKSETFGSFANLNFDIVSDLELSA